MRSAFCVCVFVCFCCHVGPHLWKLSCCAEGRVGAYVLGADCLWLDCKSGEGGRQVRRQQSAVTQKPQRDLPVCVYGAPAALTNWLAKKCLYSSATSRAPPIPRSSGTNRPVLLRLLLDIPLCPVSSQQYGFAKRQRHQLLLIQTHTDNVTTQLACTYNFYVQQLWLARLNCITAPPPDTTFKCAETLTLSLDPDRSSVDATLIKR